LRDSAEVFVVDANAKHLRRVTSDGADHESVSWSPNARRIAFAAVGCGSQAVEVADVIGPRPPRTIFRRRTCAGNPAVAWSPRGDLIAVMTREQDQVTDTLDVMRPQGSDTHRLAQFTSSRITDEGPTWSPDGTEFAITGEGVAGSLNLMTVDLHGRTRKLTATRQDDIDPSWSPDGRYILFQREVGPSVFVLFVISPRGGLARPLPGRWVDVWPAWSSDGKQLALAGVPVKDEGTYKGRYNLYALDVAKGSLRKLAHEPDAVHPSWSPDDRLIAFTTQYGRLKDVDVQTRAIHTLADLGDAQIDDIAWSPDGKRVAFTASKPPPSD